MNWFLNNSTKYKLLDNFPNGWTGKELMELAEDLRSSDIYFTIDMYAGYAPHVTFHSGEKYGLYQTADYQTYYPVTTEVIETVYY